MDGEVAVATVDSREGSRSLSPTAEAVAAVPTEQAGHSRVGLALGIACLALSIGLVFAFDSELNPQRWLIVRVIFALGAAAIASEVTGSLELNTKVIRASGGLGVFAAVMYYSSQLPGHEAPVASDPAVVETAPAAAAPPASSTPVAAANSTPLVSNLMPAAATAPADSGEPLDRARAESVP